MRGVRKEVRKRTRQLVTAVGKKLRRTRSNRRCEVQIVKEDEKIEEKNEEAVTEVQIVQTNALIPLPMIWVPFDAPIKRTRRYIRLWDERKIAEEEEIEAKRTWPISLLVVFKDLESSSRSLYRTWYEIHLNNEVFRTWIWYGDYLHNRLRIMDYVRVKGCLTRTTLHYGSLARFARAWRELGRTGTA